MRRTSLLLLLCAIVISIAASSCTTGYSKKTYISSLEKFVARVEADGKKYDSEDWEKADERMVAFEEKYDKYADDFSDKEVKDIVILMAKYKVAHAKATGNRWLNGIKGWFNDNQGVLDETLKDLKEIGSSIDQYVDSIATLLDMF